MDLSWSLTHREGITLVACRVHNDAAVPRRARLRNLLDGPVLPPRRRGVAESGWDAGGAEIRLDARERRALGFACPADPAEPPVELVDEERVADADSSGIPPDAADAVRDLGPYRPPREAIPTTDTDPSVVNKGETGATADAGVDEPVTDSGARRPDDADPPRSPRTGTVGVDAWLDAVERRVRRGERLTGADVATATEVLAAAGGAEAVADLDTRLASDAERLRAVAERAESLAERAETVDVPTEALEALS